MANEVLDRKEQKSWSRTPRYSQNYGKSCSDILLSEAEDISSGCKKQNFWSRT